MDNWKTGKKTVTAWLLPLLLYNELCFPI
jgi:hypothetical protein